jgi:hypothetical protein
MMNRMEGFPRPQMRQSWTRKQWVQCLKLLGFNKVNHGRLQCNMCKPSKLQHNPCELSLLISELGINMFIIHILFTSQCWFKGNLQKTPWCLEASDVDVPASNPCTLEKTMRQTRLAFVLKLVALNPLKSLGWRFFKRTSEVSSH